MKKLNLNGLWQMEGGSFNCQDNLPGAVYSFLLNNNLMLNPHFRDNELEALNLLENDFVFSRTFNIDKTNYQMLLHCDGLDTLCDIFINNQHIAHTDNMHRSYEFDITTVLKNGENEIKLVFDSPNKFVREMHKKDPVCDNPDALRGHAHLRKAACMMGWDWGARLPDAGVWKDIYILTVDSDRISEGNRSR